MILYKLIEWCPVNQIVIYRRLNDFIQTKKYFRVWFSIISISFIREQWIHISNSNEKSVLFKHLMHYLVQKGWLARYYSIVIYFFPFCDSMVEFVYFKQTCKCFKSLLNNHVYIRSYSAYLCLRCSTFYILKVTTAKQLKHAAKFKSSVNSTYMHVLVLSHDI